MSDFKDVMKCVHINGSSCNLEQPIEKLSLSDEIASLESIKENLSINTSNINYITAVDDGNSDLNKLSDVIPFIEVENIHVSRMQLWQKHSSTSTVKLNSDPNFSDSVYSIRNFSTILQTSNSNHTIYRSHSPTETAKNLVRQTSTPMIKNLVIKSPDSLMTSSSSQMSSIHSSVDSDISPSVPSNVNDMM